VGEATGELFSVRDDLFSVKGCLFSVSPLFDPKLIKYFPFP
jgi:hypothetical protein